MQEEMISIPKSILDDVLNLSQENPNLEPLNSSFHGLTILRIREKLESYIVKSCDHEIIDIRNEIVQTGYMCKKCGKAFRSGDH